MWASNTNTVNYGTLNQSSWSMVVPTFPTKATGSPVVIVASGIPVENPPPTSKKTFSIGRSNSAPAFTSRSEGGAGSVSGVEKEDGTADNNRRRQKRLDRNRKSARLSRLRRKQYLEVLEDRVTRLSLEMDKGRRERIIFAGMETIKAKREHHAHSSEPCTLDSRIVVEVPCSSRVHDAVADVDGSGYLGKLALKSRRARIATTSSQEQLEQRGGVASLNLSSFPQKASPFKKPVTAPHSRAQREDPQPRRMHKFCPYRLKQGRTKFALGLNDLTDISLEAQNLVADTEPDGTSRLRHIPTKATGKNGLGRPHNAVLLVASCTAMLCSCAAADDLSLPVPVGFAAMSTGQQLLLCLIMCIWASVVGTFLVLIRLVTHKEAIDWLDRRFPSSRDAAA